jgi:hypothetical protein
LWLLVAGASKQAPGLQLPAGLVPPVPAADVMAPGNPFPNSSRPRGLAACGHQTIHLLVCCHMDTLNLLLSARSLPPHTQVNPRLHALLVPGGFPPHRAGGQALPTVPDSKRALAPLLKRKSTRFPTEGRKAPLILCRQHWKPCFLKVHSTFTLRLPAGESCLSCPSAGIPGLH